ncbi:CMP-N-acetylneuraminate-beta-galactosamide-alpha-2,3-sialyltransferase 4-like [Ptychodera flava]|uniref:CMP-N-acetylneuraminate-beta-galactosamide- alpha-2,3-sialyltransferase 4-like n=1 Tax=Ptychodera flava TaxID=63121 RepID=UPI00396A360B
MVFMFSKRTFFLIVLFSSLVLMFLYLNTPWLFQTSIITHLHWQNINKSDRYQYKEAVLTSSSVRNATGKTKNNEASKNTSTSRHKEATTVKTSTSSVNVTCQRGYVQDRVKRLIPGFDIHAHLFLEPGYRTWKEFERMKRTGYPYGMAGTGDIIDSVLKMLPAAGKRDRFGERDEVCRRCILVGSSGVSLGKNVGSQIDKYDVVIRMNDAKVENYEADVGKKTTFRFIYPESAAPVANRSVYETNTDIAFLVYKPNDIRWLEAVLKKEDPRKTDMKFGNSVPGVMTTPAKQVRLVSPRLHVEARDQFLSAKKRPSCGYVALVMALHYCDHVDITGYGFDPKVPVHYFKGRDQGMPKRGAHSWTDEEQHILQMLHCGIIEHDLTGHFAKEVKGWEHPSVNCTRR